MSTAEISTRLSSTFSSHHISPASMTSIGGTSSSGKKNWMMSPGEKGLFMVAAYPFGGRFSLRGDDFPWRRVEHRVVPKLAVVE